MRALPKDIIATVIIAVIAFFLLHTTIQSSIVVGPSMEPTVEEAQRLLVNKLAYLVNRPERGDIIIFHPPSKQQVDYIKRLIALPGDTVEIKDGAVYVNGKKLEEPYIKDPPYYSLSLKEIPQNSYFVLGDNRNNSNDSHNGWTIQRSDIIGKVWLRIWPLEYWGTFPSWRLDTNMANIPQTRVPNTSIVLV